MVNHGVSRPCGTCKLRKKKCDQTRPICKACIRTKWECLGYKEETDLVFRHHATEATLARIKHCSTPLGSSPSNQSLFSRHPTDDDLEKAALDVFVRDYCLPAANPLLSRGYLQSVVSNIRETGGKSAVSNAARVVAFEGLGRRHGRPSMRRKAQWLYQAELRAFQRRMIGKSSFHSADSLCVAILFGLYEIVSSFRPGSSDHSVHALGITAILRTHNSPFGLMKNMTVESPLNQNIPSFFSPPSAAATKALDLGDLAATLGEIFERSMKYFDPNQTALQNELELRILFSDVEQCFSTLIAWPKDQHQAWQPTCIGMATGNQVRGDHGTICWPGRIDIYLDRWVAAVWAIWRKGVIVLAAIAIRCAKALPSCPELFAVASRMKEDAMPVLDSMFSSIPYFLLDNPSDLFGEPPQKIKIAPPVGGLLVMHVLFIMKMQSEIISREQEEFFVWLFKMDW